MVNYYKVGSYGSITLIPEEWVILDTPKVLKVNYPPFNDQRIYRKSSTRLYTDLNDAKYISKRLIKRLIVKTESDLEYLNNTLDALNSLDEKYLSNQENKSFNVQI